MMASSVSGAPSPPQRALVRQLAEHALGEPIRIKVSVRRSLLPDAGPEPHDAVVADDVIAPDRLTVRPDFDGA